MREDLKLNLINHLTFETADTFTCYTQFGMISEFDKPEHK